MLKALRLLIVLAGLMIPKIIHAQSASIADCLGAIPICQPVYVETRSPVGGGDHLEIHPVDNCMREERNSIWYTFTVGKSGNFGFVLTPNDPGDDYDWALFDITTADCGDLFDDEALIVSCNAAGNDGCKGPTGADGSTEFAVQGFNCGNAVPDRTKGFSTMNALIPVEAGNTYALCVSNFSSTTNGFEIDFSLSGEIDIFDDELPRVEAVSFPDKCAITTFEFRLSEPVLCASVDAVNFRLVVGEQEIPLLLNAGNCYIGGNFSRTFQVTVNDPIERGVDYSLEIRPTENFPVTDLCGNNAEPFRFEGRTPPGSPLELGADTTLCDGQRLTLDLSPFGFTSIEWQDGSAEPVYSVSAPGEYSVTVETECGIFQDAVTVSYEGAPPSIDLGPDTDICPQSTLRLSLPAGEAFYQWGDGQTGAEYEVTSPGTYSVTATNGCGSSTDEIAIGLYPEITLNLPSDTVFCPGENLQLTAVSPGATFFQWKDQPFGPTLTVNMPGVYTVLAGNACDTLVSAIEVRECVQCNVYFPNAFSPNNDGVNDLFQPFSDCPLSDFQMRLFDRWGNLLVEIDDPDIGWDGLVRGQETVQGLYIWVARFSVMEEGAPRTVEEAGEVLVVR